MVITKTAIILSADSKQKDVSLLGHTANSKPALKIEPINDKTVIAVVGMGNLSITQNGAVVFSHDTASFLEEIRHSVLKDAPVSVVAEVVRNKSQVTLNELLPYVRNGFFDEQKAPTGDIVNYIIAGYENGSPRMTIVSIKPDWGNRQLTGPFIEPKYPAPNLSPSGAVKFYGSVEAIVAAATPGSDASRVCTEKYPSIIGAIQKISTEQGFTEAEGIQIAADMIRLQAKFDPERVGLPVSLVVIHNGQIPVVQSLSK
jgi:hypothetical protein